MSSSDGQEAIRCVKELDVPHFMHELVYQVRIKHTGHQQSPG